jgi:hypothetical protein
VAVVVDPQARVHLLVRIDPADLFLVQHPGRRRLRLAGLPQSPLGRPGGIEGGRDDGGVRPDAGDQLALELRQNRLGLRDAGLQRPADDPGDPRREVGEIDGTMEVVPGVALDRVVEGTQRLDQIDPRLVASGEALDPEP